MLPSGKVVVRCLGDVKTKHASVGGLGDEPEFCVFGGSEWRKLKQLPGLCEHQPWGQDVAPVTTENQELLAVSCDECEVIRLLNLETGESSTAFHDPAYRPQFLCTSTAKQGQLFVLGRDEMEISKVFLQLDFSSVSGTFGVVLCGLEHRFLL